jgi:hypothetical protein
MHSTKLPKTREDLIILCRVYSDSGSLYSKIGISLHYAMYLLERYELLRVLRIADPNLSGMTTTNVPMTVYERNPCEWLSHAHEERYNQIADQMDMHSKAFVTETDFEDDSSIHPVAFSHVSITRSGFYFTYTSRYESDEGERECQIITPAEIIDHFWSGVE